MLQLLRKRDQQKGAIAEVEFEGVRQGAGVSFFIGDLAPGRGPPWARQQALVEVAPAFQKAGISMSAQEAALSLEPLIPAPNGQSRLSSRMSASPTSEIQTATSPAGRHLKAGRDRPQDRE